ncbi:hypothetical protein C8R43DRAFT_608334 [Mycena crocata]|nr:hypothetical protein C8R43DRAFT_608334 [Mycena crocata]
MTQFFIAEQHFPPTKPNFYSTSNGERCGKQIGQPHRKRYKRRFSLLNSPSFNGPTSLPQPQFQTPTTCSSLPRSSFSPSAPSPPPALHTRTLPATKSSFAPLCLPTPPSLRRRSSASSRRSMARSSRSRLLWPPSPQPPGPQHKPALLFRSSGSSRPH